MSLFEFIKKHTDLQFGVCDFSALKDALIPCRAALRLPKDAKSVVCFLFPYKVEENPPKNISRYAAVPDYHGVCLERLEILKEKLSAEYKEYTFECFVDNSPIPEVRAAAAAGLGKIGQNGLLINEKYGSFVFLGEIVTDMPLECEDNTAFCENCGLCRTMCPVGLDKARCLSALTQKKGEMSAEEQEMLLSQESVWGCDICQNVCPHNKTAERTDICEFLDGYRDRYVLGENTQNRAYAWRGERVVRRNAELQNITQVVAADTTEEKHE